ncbi:MAG TPA: MerR family transcriptional regulator [Thermomicrobiales bacterium]|jgi:DNA-binding transcriptional MerR regulator
MERYRLADLADLTGVTQRTIRFYIAEGLLPPPEGAGPAAVYTAVHRDRLALINGLKERYLPLREIRSRLATLTEAEIRAELQQIAAEPPPDPATTPPAALPPSEFTPYPKPIPIAHAHERWERITLSDGVELHVRADRLREAIPLDALVRQARKVLGEG